MAEQGIRHHRAASSGQFPLINGIGAGWYEKDYTTYGYEFGSWKSRFDLFDAGLERIEARLGQLIPPPVRKIPILIGGAGPKRTLPAWHARPTSGTPSSGDLHRSQRPSRGAGPGRGTLRKRHRTLGALLGAPSAEAYRATGASTFITRSPPTPPPVTTSTPWRKCRPGVTVSSEGAVSTMTAAQEVAQFLGSGQLVDHVTRPLAMAR
jgi:hypothetical protein